MRAMILAAGRGLRMGELTEHTPKPLLRAGSHYLIEYSIHALTAIGIKDIVINICYKKEQIKSALGDGKNYGAHFHYSEEDVALETGGGIVKALPLLGKEPFIVLSSDVISDYPLQQLPKNPEGLAHIVLVNNPDFHPLGDFNLDGAYVNSIAPCQYTYANIGVYRPEFFSHCTPGKLKLGDVLKEHIKTHSVTGEHFQGLWRNVGTKEELAPA